MPIATVWSVCYTPQGAKTCNKYASNIRSFFVSAIFVQVKYSVWGGIGSVL